MPEAAPPEVTTVAEAVPAETTPVAEAPSPTTNGQPTEAVAPVEPAATAPPPAPPARPAPPPVPAIDLSKLPPPPADVAYIIVNEAGASVYSTSVLGKEEFPQHDATLRSAVSLGRRLQDPLAELVKVEPQHLGVGLYQHDMSPKWLRESLEGVVESCVNHVGVDVNTASVPLLRYVSGLNQHVARELVEFRSKHGPFKKREQLQQVPGVGHARYVQAAGFLKIHDPEDPLDQTWVHPESYPAATQVLAELGCGVDVLRDRSKLGELTEKLKALPIDDVAKRLNIGAPTLRDIVEALGKPGRDPREDLPEPVFKKGILKLEDLHPGMELKGTVLNVVDFGAFVDVGLKDSGLVHVSQLSNRFVKNPHDVVTVGDVVTVWVLAVDNNRRRVSLSMVRPGTERPPPERRPEPPPRPPREQRPPQQQPQQQRGGPPRGRRQPPPRRGDRRPPPGQAAEAPPPPPRRPVREAPKPKLSKAALEGAAPLHSFSELKAFFEAQRDKPAQEEKKGEEPPAV